jgi:alpha-mannosidase
MSIAGRNLNAAIQAIAWKIHIKPELSMLPVLVFNPHAWNSQFPIEVEVNQLPENCVLTDENNRVIPHQIVRSESAAPWRSRICFIAEIPSLGYRVYRLKPGVTVNQESRAYARDYNLENEYLQLKIDPQTGWIQSLTDKRLNIELLAGPAAKPVVIADPSDTWSHNIFKFDAVCGDFTDAEIQVIESGPIKATFRVANKYNKSTLIQDFTIYQGLETIEVAVTVDWHECNKLLKLRFPFRISATHMTYEIPYGHIERIADGDENPGQNWVDVSGAIPGYDGLYGVSLLNNGKYSFDSHSQDSMNEHDIGLTILRSPVYAHHLPMVLDSDGIYNIMDQGLQSFHYVIYPHKGGWEDAYVVHHAAEVNQTPFVLLGSFHPEGTLPQVGSFLSVDVNNIIVSVLKKSEDTDDMILRCYEIAGRTAHATISIPLLGRTHAVVLNPCEIKTLRIPLDPAGIVEEVNLLEFEDV